MNAMMVLMRRGVWEILPAKIMAVKTNKFFAHCFGLASLIRAVDIPGELVTVLMPSN